MISFELPKTIDIPEIEDKQTYDMAVKTLYAVFAQDFITSKTYFRAKPVKIALLRTQEDYPDIFWHIITRQDKKIDFGKRLLDYERAKRLPWIKPIIQHYTDAGLKTWYCSEFNKNSGHIVDNYYLWYVEEKFLVILKEVKKQSCYLLTAFYVNNSNKAHFENLYLNGNKQPWT